MSRLRFMLVSLALGALVSGVAAQDFWPDNDLTADGAVAHGTAQATIIDTRTFSPQIQVDVPWTGPVTPIGKHLPPHGPSPRPPLGEPNDLPVGGLLGSARVEPPAALFPGLSQTPWVPPDPNMAVGPNHIVETVNMAIAFYTKTGTLQFSANLDSTGSPGFFETVGAGNFTFDPKCFYDHYSGRFVVLAFEMYDPTEAWIDIAVSDDSDPNGIWYKYRTWAVVNVSGANYWVDYPGLGYDAQGYYVTGNLFRLGGSGTAGALFRIFDKAPMLTGAPVSFSDLRRAGDFSVQVAQSHGTPIAPMYASVANTTHLNIFAIKDPLTAPTFAVATVAVPAFSTTVPNAPNSGGTGIWILDGRIMNVHWRDGNLYVTHCIGFGSKAVARWYHFTTGTWPTAGTPALVQSGNIDPGGNVFTFYPAIYSSVRDAVGLVLGRSSTAERLSIQVTGRKPTDPLGTMGALTQAQISTSGYTGYRWGDFFGICADPVDDNKLWVIGEYCTGTGSWNTWITSFTITPAPGDMNCDGVVDFNDIDPFVLALSGQAGYQAQFPNCDYYAGDINGDGSVDFADIDPFVAILTG